MFGYIRAYKPEMRMREYDYYRAAYCGLCRATGKCCTGACKAALSYDMVFAVLVRLAISGRDPEFEKRRCALHPFKKRLFMKINPELEFGACAGTLLACGKLDDDVKDERGKKRLAARLARLALRRGRKKAASKMPEIAESVKDGLSKLAETESRAEASVDTPADIFGEMMAKILSYELSGNDAKLAREIGRRAGRWVYITDAVDDCESDIKKGRYNPFALLYGKAPDEHQREIIAEALRAEIVGIEKALDLIDVGDRRDLFCILENILKFGMPASAERALKEERKEKKKSEGSL